MNRRVTARGVIFDNGKLFCVKLTGYRNGKPADYWCTPGGGIDEGESLLDAMHREMVEETGVAPEVGALLYMQQYADKVEEQLEFFFHIKNAADYKTINLEQTSHGAKEIAAFDFVDPKTHMILPAFLSEQDIADDIAQNGPVKIFNYL